MTIFSVVAVAALPLVLVGIKAASRAEVQTLAKDLSQLRIERIRNLPYQVDRQNGPFVDLLDRYYTDATGAVTSSVDEPGCSGQYVANAAGPVGAPTGPAYRVTCTSLPEAAGFSQKVYLQFLTSTMTAVTPPSTYSSQVTGKDSAPSGLVGVTVLTDWALSGQTGSLRTYTEIADARSDKSLIATQAQAVALRVSSNFVDTVNAVPQNRNLVAQAGVVKADGSLTSGSVASVQAAGVSLDHVGAGNTVVEQQAASVASTTAPTVADPAGTVAEVSVAGVGAGTTADTTWLGCGWGWAGKSAYANVSATTAAGRPVVPSNNTTDVTAAGVQTAQSGLLNSGNGCSGYAFGFRNWLTTPTYTLGISPAKPLVYVEDPTGGGGTLAGGRALGEAAVTGTDIVTVPHTASATARARVSKVHMLPTAERPEGLVTATLTSSKVVCKAGVPVSSAYALTVTWPNGGSKTINYASGGPTPTLPAPSSIAFTDGGVARTLADYLEWSVSTGVTESTTSGAQSIDQVFGLTSPASVVGPGGLAVQLGSLSCNAADDR
jgi:hypothetical protein